MKQVLDDLQVSRRGDCRGGFRFRRSGLVGSPVRAWEGNVAIPTVFLSRSCLGAARRRRPRPQRRRGRTRRSTPSRSTPWFANEAGDETGDAEQECLANAVYFEARGEPLRGQLARREVVMNRAASGRFPTSLCGVVAQPAQFSFVASRPDARADRGIGSLAPRGRVAASPPRHGAAAAAVSCLWYTPIMSRRAGARLAQVPGSGLHIFYS